ncbi:MAG: hypothetical protein HKN25_10515 [Pyrinomonadaceae bacterium]|nr:hypothetical protein [Pyrinomonadaceae bacterium]
MLSRIIIFGYCLAISIFAFGCASSGSKDGTTPEMAKSVLKLRGYEVNETGFFKAIAREDALSVAGFLNAGIDPNSKNEKGETALTYALENHETDKIARILIRRADVSMQDDLGNSPLHLAVVKDKRKIFDLLIEKGAYVNVTGREGRVKNITPLYAAVLKRREGQVKKLLKNGADPNLADNEGAFPLIDAVLQKAANSNIVKMLLENGAQVNKINNNGAPALVYAVSNQDITSDVRQEIVKLLLEKGADKSIKPNDGKDALFWAKKMKNEKTVELLESK